jgi:DNA-binding transcriptional LysR family regulator
MLPPIETRHIDAILALSDELNFTRAAKRLNITQSAFSRQILQAEGIVGFPICQRDRRRVSFTDAGEVLTKQLRQAEHHLVLGIHLGNVAHSGAEQTLTAGYSPWLDPQLRSLLLCIAMPQYPNLKLETQSAYAPTLTQKLLDGHLDLAIITRPTPSEAIESSLLAKAPLYAVMPDTHPAASKRFVSLSDFASDSWIVFQEQAHPLAYRSLMGHAEWLRIKIRKLHHILSENEAVHLVSSDFGISFITPATGQRTQQPGIVCRPLSDEPLMLETHLCIRKEDRSNLVNAFCRTFLRKHKEMRAEPQLRLPLWEDISAVPLEKTKIA